MLFPSLEPSQRDGSNGRSQSLLFLLMESYPYSLFISGAWHGHPSSLIRVIAVRLRSGTSMLTAKTLIRLGGRLGLYEYLLGACHC